MSKHHPFLQLCAWVLTLTTIIGGSSGATANGSPVPKRREVYGNGKIYDITHRYMKDMPSWESKKGIGQFLWLIDSIKNGSLANGSEMKLYVHSGTHVDAPGHFYDDYFDAGFDVDTLDLEVLNGNNYFII